MLGIEDDFKSANSWGWVTDNPGKDDGAAAGDGESNLPWIDQRIVGNVPNMTRFLSHK